MKRTQCERILEYMTDFGSISPMEAFGDIGCQRLAARIADLKASGHRIRTDRETGKNRYGEPISYCRYYLEEK